MTIAVDVAKRLGAFELRAAFRSGERLAALFGPSGSGKTTLVHLVAGLARPDAGRIAVGDTVLFDSAAGIDVPRHRRRIGYVFQDARLFPHLSVRSNLLYGRWFTRATEGEPNLDSVVALLGITHLLGRRPGALSGGERQRVAIGRALLARPRLLLMDEPLSALDEARKAEIIPYIERLRDEAGIPILYVSHSLGEVARLAADMVVLDAGRVVAQGEPLAVARRLDLLPAAAEVEPGRFLDVVATRRDERYGLTTLVLEGGEIVVPDLDLSLGQSVRLRVRARDVMLALERPVGVSALNVLAASVGTARPDGLSGMEVSLDCGGQELLARITRRSFDELRLAPGMAVFAVLKSVSFDRRFGEDADARPVAPTGGSP
ncbi:molybdenum ABC transporter ATP-binding protein [Aureimonas leprariae]|uniref:Molybdenum ABC transporter ATP-binding protein n=1 Tax=Plantimonas leprariae TaxID=2615207 RepID=A0A7V7TY05_9HYPH|nr:molybdenum ABC transporter ATP-binding protein [Aureimonas leprariae]KAB0682665.1 molybdenum ABC transporter ATP-binding protein [Aureimonas leprariae]